MSKKMQKDSVSPRSPQKPAKPVTAQNDQTTLAEGSKAPSFSLPQAGGGTVSLADFAGRNLVLFFYPRAGTPGCTLEASDFSRLAPKFAALDTGLLGISADPIKAIETFHKKHLLKFPLATDEDAIMLKTFGVWDKKSMYGKTFDGIVRSTFLIGKTNRILKIWRKVKVDGHAENVLAAVKAAAAGSAVS